MNVSSQILTHPLFMIILTHESAVHQSKIHLASNSLLLQLSTHATVISGSWSVYHHLHDITYCPLFKMSLSVHLYRLTRTQMS